MDELASKCARFASVIRADYRNTYDHRARSLSTCLNWSVSRRIANEWRELRPDVIHINKQNLEDGLDLLQAAGRCRAPSICTIHLTQDAQYLQAKAAWLRDSIARWQLRKYSGVFVAVQQHRAEMLKAFLAGRGRVAAVCNGVPSVDTSTVRSLRAAKRQELGFSERDFLVLGVGRLVEQKRPFAFLRLAKELRDYVPQAKFLWVGDGKLAKSWQGSVTQLGLNGVVSCAGWQSDVLAYLSAADLLLHVAEFEGLPLAVVEAMASGLPCAVTRDLANEVPLFTEDNVLFVDRADELAQQIQDPWVLTRIAERGRRLVVEQLSAKKMAESYEQLYVRAAKIRAIQLLLG